MFLMALQALTTTTAQAVATAQAVVATHHDTTEVVPYLTSAAAIVMVQKWLKCHPLYAAFVDKFPAADKWAHRFVAACGTLIVALGIHVTFDWNWANGGVWKAALPGGWALLHGLGDFIKVYILQDTIHEATKQPPAIRI